MSRDVVCVETLPPTFGGRQVFAVADAAASTDSDAGLNVWPQPRERPAAEAMGQVWARHAQLRRKEQKGPRDKRLVDRLKKSRTLSRHSAAKCDYLCSFTDSRHVVPLGDNYTMKKFAAVVITAFMMASGLVAFTGSSASAARCPYTGCLKTATSTSGPYNIPNRTAARVKVRVAAAGNSKPNGTLIIVVRKQGKGKIRVKTAAYRGTPKVIRSGKLYGKGKYKVIVKYRPGPNDPYKRSRGIKLLQVR